MGLAVGTFAYCLVVLRAVRGSSEAGAAFIPHVSSGLSLALAIVTIVALVAFLDRSARTMQVGHIIHQVTEETTRRIRNLYPESARAAPPAEPAFPTGSGHAVKALASGWVCHIDTGALLRLTPPAGVMRLDVRNGSFVVEAQAIGVVWPPPDDPETFAKSVSGAIVLGDSRVLLTDVAFGIRQLVDIGLRALSPGINDPTTAYDVIVHLGIVVRDLLWRDLTPAEHVADGRRLVTANDLSHDDYVNRAFDQIRLAGAMQSAIAATLMQTLGTIAAHLERDALEDRAKALRRQGALALATYEAGSPLQEDLARVRALAERYGFRPELLAQRTIHGVRRADEARA